MNRSGKRHSPSVRYVGRIAATLLIVVLALPLAGCGLFGEDEAELQSVADSHGFYHVKVPADWQTRVDPALTTIYAAAELPETDTLQNPAILIFLAETPEDAGEIDEELVRLLEERAESRGWSGTTISDPEDVVVGGREGRMITVTATDQNGIAFTTEVFFVRTLDRDILVMALAPDDAWEEFSAETEALRENWFWHMPESEASDEATESADEE
jgi:hypothetical protein